jgi:hypothetical protein
MRSKVRCLVFLHDFQYVNESAKLVGLQIFYKFFSSSLLWKLVHIRRNKEIDLRVASGVLLLEDLRDFGVQDEGLDQLFVT